MLQAADWSPIPTATAPKCGSTPWACWPAPRCCGKAAGPVEGDSFDDFATDLAPADIAAFFDAADPRALAVAHLGTATTRIIYDLERVPVCAASIARETHVSDLAPGSADQGPAAFRLFRRVRPGGADQGRRRSPVRSISLIPNSPVADPRWVGTGEKIYNNKGKPVRQYEPFFSATPQFSIEKWGVSSTLFYDPLERVVATLHPNNTFEKVVFDPWQQTIYDVNDTVTFDPKTDPDVGEFFSGCRTRTICRPGTSSGSMAAWARRTGRGAEGRETRQHADHRPFRHAGPDLPDHRRQRQGSERQRPAICDAHRARHRGQPARGHRCARPRRHAL